MDCLDPSAPFFGPKHIIYDILSFITSSVGGYRFFWVLLAHSVFCYPSCVPILSYTTSSLSLALSLPVLHFFCDIHSPQRHKCQHIDHHHCHYELRSFALDI
eukprot:982486_1